ncbi:ankyrin repeat-containing domain protein [Hypoxylon crocopeplum]|nr:ankyrin repeat-containing domain protein [Hypoxylon crocopeplum]
MAAYNGNTEIVRLLADNDATFNTADAQGNWPIHQAAAQDHEETMQYLVENGADIEVRNFSKMTPLLIASRAGKRTRGPENFTALHYATNANDTVLSEYGTTALSLAAGRGHKDIISLLLDSGANIATEAKDLWTPLHYAAHYGQEAAVKDGSRAQSLAAKQGHVAVANLLKQRTPVSKQAFRDSASQHGNVAEVTRLANEGVDVNSMDPNGRRAISAAAETGQELVVDLLIEIKADPDLQDANGESPLWWAARYGVDVDAADSDRQTPLSVASQKGIPDSTVSYGKTALLFAAAGGHYRVVELLISSGADIGYVSPEDETALSLADAHGHGDIATLLRSHGALEAPSDRQVKYAKNLLDAAENGCVAEITRLLRAGVKVNDASDDKIPIIWAAYQGQDAAIRTLIKHGAVVDTRDKFGRTPMCYAASWGHGARINIQDNSKRTPLSLASESGYHLAVGLLLELGAKKEIKDSQSRTALWHAVTKERMAVVEVLLEKGANIESADEWGYTPLTQAVRQGNRPFARFLLEKGARIRPESFTNRSPLCLASAIGSENLVELLIDHGADLNHLSDNRDTPIAIAAKEGHTMVVKILIEMGANVHIKDDNGRTALSYAKELGNEPVVKLLSQAATLLQEGLNQKRRYQYRALKQEGYIRILELDPGRKGDIISFELYDTDLSKNPPFEALSYEWKERSGTIPVQCGRERLLRIRHETDRRSLWIDAVCINQEDKQECNQQVAMMTEIYRKARSVLMWIGEEDNTTEAAFNRIPMLCQLHESLRKDANGSSWEHFPIEERDDVQGLVHDVMEDENAYFTRAWIFQEIILAGSRGLVMAALLGFLTCVEASSPSFYEIVRCDDILRQSGQLELSQTSSAMTVFEASDARDKIFATLRLTSVRGASIKRPVADYTLTVQEVYTNATRYFVDIYQGMEVWNVSHRSSTKTTPNLPSWVADFTRPEDDLYLNPFPNSAPAYRTFIKGRTTTTPISLHIDGCLVDKVAFRVPITKETDVYGIVKPAVQALARHGRSVYDPYLGRNKTNKKPATLSRRSKALKVSFPRNKTLRRSGPNHRDQVEQMTNGHAILDTIFGSDSVSGYDDEQVAAFLAWKLSVDADVPSCSKQAPHYLQSRITKWEARSRARKDFDLDICHNMEDELLYETELVYTEKGYFGLTNRGEAQEGLWVAIVGGAHFPVLLREKRENQDVWYEFVDRVFLNHLTETVEKLEDMHGNVRIQRLEIR